MATGKDSRPNIIFVFTDQQSATMLSCAGNAYLRTPAMDRLAAAGVRFERAYCTNPVCMPSRFSLMTGRMPSAIDMTNNAYPPTMDAVNAVSPFGLGWLFRQAGYDVAYGGKVHLPMTPEDLGFDCISADERDGLAETCAEYVRRDRDRPFLLVASFVNPHDICFLALGDFGEGGLDEWMADPEKIELATLSRALRRPDGISDEEFFRHHCPPLPANFEPQEDEPEAIRMIQAQRDFKQKAREQWSEERWRLHRWAYCRLTERVDAQIGRILDALHQAGKEEQTIIVFSSDHGDLDSAHRMEHKTALYEEPCRVPLIITPPGTTTAGTVNADHLVSNGLDLVPTLCDYAGIEPPDDLEGVSLRPLVEGRAPESWRSFLPVESEFGRMIVTARHKYMFYHEGAGREQLIDLPADPGEMRNAAHDPANEGVLQEHRRLFSAYFGH